MGRFVNNFRTNYDALTAATKGASPANQVLWGAILLTVFEEIESWVNPAAIKRMQEKTDDGQ